jgi:integrase
MSDVDDGTRGPLGGPLRRGRHHRSAARLAPGSLVGRHRPRPGCAAGTPDPWHTSTTLLLSKGVHPKVVADVLGHASVTITLDTYSHVIPGLGDTAASAMEDVLGYDPDE